MVVSDAALAYYTAPAPITDLSAPCIPDTIFAGLPDDPGKLRGVLPELVVHGDLAHLYGLPAPPTAEMHIRSARALVATILGKQPSPLAEPRPADRRLIGTCRHFALLYCALLRHQGTPARVRCGFAHYFDRDQWVDHWITEYWHGPERCWVRVDPQLDERQLSAFQIPFDPADLPAAGFLAAAEAWHRYRAGKLDPAQFGTAEHRGVWFMAASVIRDLAALNKVEMLPWDYWGPMIRWCGNDAAVDLPLVDRAAAIVLSGQLSDVELHYRNEPGLTVPSDDTLIQSER